MFYREEGGEWEVSVHSDEVVEHDDGSFREVMLECVRELRPSPVFGSIKLGALFNVDCRVGAEGAVGWQLSDEPCS